VQKLGFKEVKELINNDIVSYLQEWLPGGKIVGNEYMDRNPTRDDSKEGSFKINIKTKIGVWEDFATGEKGGDVISLYRLLNGLADDNEARKKIIKRYNFTSLNRIPAAKISGEIIGDGLELVVPIPKSAPKPPSKLKAGEELLEYAKRYEYKNADGELLCYVDKFNTVPKKTMIPRSLWKEKSGKYKWLPKALPSPRPLYGLDKLAKYPEKPVMVVEGEKCVDALWWYFLDNENNEKRGDIPYVPITWPGGANGDSNVDFRPLLSREIIYWPDNDDDGFKVMRRIKALHNGTILDIGALEKEKGWDVADLISENAKNKAFDLGQYVRDILDRQIMEVPNLDVRAPDAIFLHVNRKGERIDSMANVKALLNFYRMRVEYNVISKKMEYTVGGKKYITVDSANDFLISVKSLCAINGVQRGDIKGYLSYVGSENSINPVLNWINSKPYKYPAGVPKPDFSQYLMSNPSESSSGRLSFIEYSPFLSS